MSNKETKPENKEVAFTVSGFWAGALMVAAIYGVTIAVWNLAGALAVFVRAIAETVFA